MLTLEELRAEINETDGEISALLERRNNVAFAVGEIKKADGKNIFVPEREEEILARFPSVQREAFRSIMRISRSIQYGEKEGEESQNASVKCLMRSIDDFTAFAVITQVKVIKLDCLATANGYDVFAKVEGEARNVAKFLYIIGKEGGEVTIL